VNIALSTLRAYAPERDNLKIPKYPLEAEIARRADICPGQIYRLRREIRVGSGADRSGRGWRRVSYGAGNGDRVCRARLRIPASIPAGLAAAGGRGQSVIGAMIPVPSGVRVWLAVGHTDTRRGMNSLALQVQESKRG